MKTFLNYVLFPVLSKMGVTQADFSNVMDQLDYWLVALDVLIVVLIVAMLAAHKAKKGFRHVIRWQAGLAFIVIVTVMVNIICYGPMYITVSGYLNASKPVLREETIAQSKDTVRKVGEEGMVLVKNDGLLPLDKNVKNLNVFGWDSTNPLFGGTGSGSSDSSLSMGILDSLKNAGYETNETLTKMYTDYCSERTASTNQSQDWSLPEPTSDYYTDDIMKEAENFSDTAVIVIGRSGGEGADLPMDMNAVINGTYDLADSVSVIPDNYGYTNAAYNNNGTEPDFDPGESYLELSHPEKDMIRLVCDNFEHVIVIINANNTMELGWVDEYKNIESVILAPGAGVTGFEALGKIINGTVNPSGRTVDTYVKDLTKTPYYNNFGNFSYTNVDDLKNNIAEADNTYEGNLAFVNYTEGIYVGYKFYETAAEENAIEYDDYVQYPFGYGLSYTTFEKTMKNFKDNGDTVSFDIAVKNAGNISGKDVVEIYYTPPYENGGIEKSSVNLIDFAKTELLEPGEQTTISFTINKEDMASYDSSEIKVPGGGYILEAGTYTISLREDSHTVLEEENFEVKEDISYAENGRSTDKTVPVNHFQDYARGNFTELSRKDGFANYEEACGELDDAAYIMDDTVRSQVEETAIGYYDPKKYQNSDDVMPTMGAKNKIKLADLTGKSYDDEMWDSLLDELTFDEMNTLINMGGCKTAAVNSISKAATSDCDGPAGLANYFTKTFGTAFPAAILLAQTWNKELAKEEGQSIGQEFADAKNYGWYGPAMNTHRSAFCGRNFEYYSEDSTLAGMLAENVVNGADQKGVYAYIKHFALNEQETNRCSFLLTFASEQAIREIYLKPFEMVVKNFHGTSQAVMTACNWIGTKPACANENLLNDVLREEWGFQGLVQSDYFGSYGYELTDHSIRSGNDMMLGYYMSASTALSEDSATVVLNMRQACKNILYTVANSGNYTVDNGEKGMTNMTRIFLTVDIVLAVLVIGTEVIVLRRWKKKQK